MAMGKALLLKVAGIAVTATVAGVAVFLVVQPSAADRPVAQAWIDNPVDGSVLTLGPVAIVAHAYDPDGLAGIRVLVDRIEQEKAEVGSPNENLGYAQMVWVPPGPGRYVLTAIGHDRAGDGGLPGQAVITVVGDRVWPTAAPTIPPTVPPTTPPPCTPAAPVLQRPPGGEIFSSVGPYAPTFAWTAGGGAPACPASGFRVEITYRTTVVTGDTPASVMTWKPAPLPCGVGQIDWRVGAKRSDGTIGAWSSRRRFWINCVPA